MLELSHVGERHLVEPFLSTSSPESEEDKVYDDHADEVTAGQAYCLYLSHFLSMWNSRMYEFGAILFIQAAFPGDLTATSINGIAETVCVLFFSSALGRWVDRAPSRLRPLLLTIIINRITVVACCLVWFFILSSQISTHKHVLFAVALILGMVEKLSRMTNLLSMERDWIPTLAPPSSGAIPSTPYDLTHLNTIMRRIDMLCKLAAPLAISAFISAFSHMKAVVGVALISILSWGVEYWGVQKVWRQNGRLRAAMKPAEKDLDRDTRHESRLPKYSNIRSPQATSQASVLLSRMFTELRASFYSHLDGLQYYFSTSVWIPSVCVAILHASVLTYSATLITYLLNAGFSLSLITIARAIGACFEIASTFIFPWAVRTLSKTSTAGPDDAREPHNTEAQNRLLDNRYDDENESEDKDCKQTPPIQNLETGVAKVGLWGICSQSVTLIPVLISLFSLPSTAPPSPSTSPLTSHPLATTSLLLFLSLSLLARWTYDLATTQLTQTFVPASHRSAFAGTEMAIVSCVSLVHWVAAAVWHQQSEFRWLALGSGVAVGGAAGGYAVWWCGFVREEEGRRGEVRGERVEGRRPRQWRLRLGWM